MRLGNIKVLFVALMAAAMFSCEKNDEKDLLYNGPTNVSFIKGGSTFTAVEGDENQFGIDIGVNTVTGSDRTYTVEIDTEESTAVEGTDFNLDSKTVTVKAGDAIGTVTMTPVVPKGMTVVINLVSNDFADYSITSHTVDVLCASDLTGIYTAVSSGSIGTDYPYEVTITEGGTNGVYTFSDITGGLYVDGYGASDQPAEVVDNCGVLILDNQPDTVYGGDFFDGAGTVNTDGTLTLTWSNGYGDFGTSVFTKN
jgi:hypothetical protein